MVPLVPDTVAEVSKGLADHEYLADEGLATSIFLALRLQRPLLLEGEAGVGKTEVAKVLARWTGGELVRLQCYEGIDASQAVYEWDYSRQLLHLRAVEASHERVDEDELYSERFLVKRPLLRALAHDGDVPPVLLIDEIDRADDEFEAFLLEILSDWAVSVPELGVVRADVPPVVVLTSIRTRDVHDALKRRCLYHWIAHPDFERELAIVRLRAPQVPELLARDVAAAAEELRGLELYKPPGVAETIDPFGGSYYLEKLTDALEQRVYEYFRKLDELGGMVRAIELGFPQREISEAAYRSQQKLEKQAEIIVGVNDFVSDEAPVEILKIDPRVEHEQIAKVQQLRQTRDNALLSQRLAALASVAQSDANMMPAIVDVVRAYGTIGEIADVLRGVWGTYEEETAALFS